MKHLDGGCSFSDSPRTEGAPGRYSGLYIYIYIKTYSIFNIHVYFTHTHIKKKKKKRTYKYINLFYRRGTINFLLYVLICVPINTKAR